MLHLYTHHDPLWVGYLQATLESAGIASVVRNAYLNGALGELPPTAIWPELWLLDARDEAKAAQLLATLLPARSNDSQD